MRVKIGNADVLVRRGDITEMAVDAIVNAANNYLWMGGGVAGAIKRKGGQIIEEEAMRQGPISVGEAVITTGGALPARHVVHAAGMGQDLKTDQGKIAAATTASLRRASENQLASIAFPAIGTGVGGFPAGDAARTMMEATRQFLTTQDTTLREVVFVLFDESTYRAFCDALPATLGSGQM